MEETWWQLVTDPHHIIAEVIINIVLDGLVIALGYGIIVKKIILPYLRRNIHKYIDQRHDVQHEEY